MRNLRKVVALVLAFAMVLSMGAVSFAADNTEADVLYDLGLFTGYSTTEKVLGLEDASNAYQAITLIGRALGWEVDMDAELAFTDVPDYAAGYVAYAVEMGITNGVSETEFGASVDGKRMATWTLRALGYGLAESWESTDTLAAEAGIEVVTGDVLRSSVVTVIYDALMATPVDGDMTVIEKLVAADPTLEAVAQEAGLVEAPAAEFALVSAETFGLGAIKVTFTSDIDTIDTLASDDVTGEVVSKDGAVAIVVFDDVAQNTEVELDIDVTGKDGVTVEDTVDVVISDKVDPEVVAVNVVNAKTFEVVYSEPVDMDLMEGPGVAVYDEVLIDGEKLVAELKVSDDLTTLTYYSTDIFDAGSYKFTTEEATDFAGFVAPSVVEPITIEADEDAPALLEVEVVDLDTIKVTFDEKVYGIDKVEIDGTAGTVVTDLTDGADVVEITLPADLEPSDAYIAVTVEFTDVEDVLGNKADAETTFMAPLDNTAPEVSVSVDKDNVIVLTFTEAIAAKADGETVLEALEAALTITEADDADAEITVVGVTADADEDYTYNVEVATAIDAIEYTVAIDGEGIIDGSVLANGLGDSEDNVMMNDKKAPVVEDILVIGTGDNVLRIVFDEAMDVETLEDVSNYLLDSAPLKNTDYTIEVADDAKSLDITIVDADNDDAAVDISGLAFEFFGLDDAAGNALNYDVAALQDVAPWTGADVVATLVDYDTIEVVASEHTFEVANADEFTLWYDTVGTETEEDGYFVKSAVVDGSKVTLTLNKDLKPDVTTNNAVMYKVELKVAGDDTKDSFGEKLTITTAIDIVDEVAPTAEIELKDTTVTVSFDETVYAATEAAVTDYLLVYNVDDKDFETPDLTFDGDAANAPVDGFLKFTFELTADDEYTIELLARNIKDAVDQKASAVAEDTYEPKAAE